VSYQPKQEPTPEMVEYLRTHFGSEDRTAEEGRSYSWKTAISGLSRHVGTTDFKSLFLHAYKWYHGEFAICDIALDRIRQDVEDYLDGKDLPDYVFRMYEKEVLKLPKLRFRS